MSKLSANFANYRHEGVGKTIKEAREVMEKKLIELCGVENSAPTVAAPNWYFI